MQNRIKIPLARWIIDRRAEKEAIDVLTPRGFEEMKATIALAPAAAPLIKGTGGCRKLRIPIPGMGKRGGARVIYLYLSPDIPIHIFAFYTKADRENLTHEEVLVLKKLTQQIKSAAKDRQVQGE